MVIPKKIKRTITIPIKFDIDEEGVICYNPQTVQFIWGVKTVVSDLWRYIGKKDDYYYISFKTLQERLETLRAKKERIDESIKIIEEVLNKQTKMMLKR